MKQFKYVRRFAELGIDDIPQVGGKNASLGEMCRELSDEGVVVPNGFATTADGYRYFVRHNGLEDRIAGALDNLDIRDVDALAAAGHRIRNWIRHGEIPADLAEEIVAAYGELGGEAAGDP